MSRCSRQTSSRYTSRKKPPYVASRCTGRRRLGNDGRMYKSTKARSGAYKWKRDYASRSERSERRRKKKQCTRKRSSSYTTRDAPPYNASHCKGLLRLGNDGRAYKSNKTRSGSYGWRLHHASNSRRRSATTRKPSGVLLQRLHPAVQRRFSELPVLYKEILRLPVNPNITFGGSNKNRQLYRYVFSKLAERRLPHNPSSVIRRIKDVKQQGMENAGYLSGAYEKWWTALYSDIPKIMDYYRSKSYT